jgi:hypothetical protein
LSRVDRHRHQRHAVRLPLRELAADRIDDPASQRDDVVLFFGERNKVAREDQPMFRVVPAYQRFQADHGEVVERHFGLEVQAEFIVVHGGLETRGQFRAARARGVQRRIVKTEHAASLGLGAVHGMVGMEQ